VIALRTHLLSCSSPNKTKQMAAMMDQFTTFIGDNVRFSQEDFAILGLNMLGCLVVYYLMRALKVPDHSWYLTLYSSGVTSFFGVYFFYHVCKDGFTSVLDNEVDLTRYVAIFFIGYCIMDLSLGSLHYGSLVTYDDGWSHHFLYIVILAYLLHNNMTPLFSVALVEELPIILLSFFSVQNKQRPSLLFGVLYFLTRVVFHTVLIYKARQFSDFVFVAGLALLLWHVEVFQGWVRGYLMRSHQRQRLSFKSKLGIMSAMLFTQIAAHSYVTYNTVVDVLAKNTNTSNPVAALHVLVWLYFLYRFGEVVHDVYTQNFIMTSIGRKKIIYNISWEDPAIDHSVMHMTPDDVVLTISSAGCNVLDYLCEGPKKIIAVDMNLAQLHTLELKLAGIRCLTQQQFFAIWGRSDFGVFTEVYKSKLRPLLAPETAEFWDQNTNLFRDNFMYAGTSGLMAKLLCMPLWWSGVAKRVKNREPITGSGGIFFQLALKMCSMTSLWSLFAPLGGVPLEQLNLLSRNPEVFVERLIEVLTTRIWKPDNYFYYGYIVGEFSPEVCPRYLEKANFALMKQRVDRVKVFHGTWAQAAEEEGPGSITIASLLDSMDWMPPQMIAENIGKVVANMDKAKGRIFWRSFADRVHSPVLAHLKGVLVPTYDRVGWYLTQFITPVSAFQPYDPSMLECVGTDSKPTNSFIDDVAVMAAMAKQGLSSKKDVKAFYKKQGSRYDGFREQLLPGRDLLMQHCVPWVKKPKTWISVGCGTARDLEYVTGHVKASGTKVYLVDLSDALLDMARARVIELGLQTQVVLVEGDINSPDVRKKLPKQADLVTCSYCLTMIPPWSEALQTMLGLVKVGGNLALIDFVTRDGAAKQWKQKLYKAWFALDGVYFNRGHVDWLKSQPNLETVWYSEEESRVPYTPYYPTHYLYCAEKTA
jgi:betaine lipid synthase